VNKISMVAAVILSLLSGNAVAEKLSDFLERASVVGAVAILSGSESLKSEVGSGCGVVYSGYVTNNIKNSDKGELIAFRARSSLMIAGVYLMFLTDAVDPTADSSSVLAGIQSKPCAESGVRLAAMVVGAGNSQVIGPESIMERRRTPGEDYRNYHKSDHYFFGDRSVKKLLDAMPDGQPSCGTPLHVDVERANFVARSVAYKADTFLKCLKEIVNKNQGDSLR